MKEEIIEEITKEYNINRKKAEELVKICLFYKYDLAEIKKKVEEFFLNEQ